MMLTLLDENRRFPELSIRDGRYDSREVRSSSNVLQVTTPTDHRVGKLRITRTTCPSQRREPNGPPRTDTVKG